MEQAWLATNGNWATRFFMCLFHISALRIYTMVSWHTQSEQQSALEQSHNNQAQSSTFTGAKQLFNQLVIGAPSLQVNNIIYDQTSFSQTSHQTLFAKLCKFLNWRTGCWWAGPGPRCLRRLQQCTSSELWSVGDQSEHRLRSSSAG